MSVRRVKRLSLEELAPCLLEVPDPPRPLVWPDVFGNDHPVELEVGCGKGLFLLSATETRAGVNFLGVEIDRKYQLFAATRLLKRGRTNVRLVCADARQFLRDCITPASIQAIHVYFPDPWWKKRHHKRRLFTADFVGACARALQPGGLLHVATDVEDYFRIIKELLANCPELGELPPPEEKPPAHDLDYLTNFERKARKQGQAVWRGDYQKLSAPVDRGAQAASTERR